MLNTIEEAIADLKLGKLVIVVDDADRENEGDFIGAAELVTPEIINFVTLYGRGLVCAPMSLEWIKKHNLQMMVDPTSNSSFHGTAFTISVDYKPGCTTGISAFDRAATIKALANKNVNSEDFARPGHVFPLQAVNGGVLERAGHTEATVDLLKIAGLQPVGLLCEILSKDGSMAKLPELRELADQFQLKIVSVADLIEYRRKTEKLVQREVEVQFPTKFGNFRLVHFVSKLDGKDHVALVKGNVNTENPVLVRVHSECLTGDVFGSARCDCGPQLEEALRMIEKEGCGVLLYMRQEGRGIGLAAKLKAYKLQEQGHSTVEANKLLGFADDLREYGIGAQILVDLGIRKLRLMTNNPRKIVGLKGYGLEIVERVPIEIRPNQLNKRYLEAKRDELGHLILNTEGEEE
ncbi:MAG: bifunctional 3,4-dihydroxy-2-butanone-4-phosphate synthase/GTP cyclohydrolase II [bacterium]|nr:bifunctional 3,4-dihydroxy-2-butanone-4-phosphate synthase/GTP cyclohydrolase II [bacterium]